MRSGAGAEALDLDDLADGFNQACETYPSTSTSGPQATVRRSASAASENGRPAGTGRRDRLGVSERCRPERNPRTPHPRPPRAAARRPSTSRDVTAWSASRRNACSRPFARLDRRAGGRQRPDALGLASDGHLARADYDRSMPIVENTRRRPDAKPAGRRRRAPAAAPVDVPHREQRVIHEQRFGADTTASTSARTAWACRQRRLGRDRGAHAGRGGETSVGAEGGLQDDEWPVRPGNVRNARSGASPRVAARPRPPGCVRARCANPLPATMGFGSSTAATTRAIPSASMRSTARPRPSHVATRLERAVERRARRSRSATVFSARISACASPRSWYRCPAPARPATPTTAPTIGFGSSGRGRVRPGPTPCPCGEGPGGGS